MLLHGDDHVSSARPKQFKWFTERLESKYKIKTQWQGQGEGYLNEVNIFNRIVAWVDVKGSAFEAGPRHAEIIAEQMELKDATAMVIPGTKDE